MYLKGQMDAIAALHLLLVIAGTTGEALPEGMAVDVFSTVRQYGLPIEVLDDYKKLMNRYAFLLVE